MFELDKGLGPAGSSRSMTGRVDDIGHEAIARVIMGRIGRVRVRSEEMSQCKPKVFVSSSS